MERRRNGASMANPDGHMEALLPHGVSVEGARWTADQSVVVTWDSSSLVRWWFARDGSQTLPARGSGEPLHGGVYLPRQQRLLTFGYGGTARLWDLARPTSGTRLRERLEIGTGLVYDDARGFLALAANEWQERRQHENDSHP